MREATPTAAARGAATALGAVLLGTIAAMAAAAIVLAGGHGIVAAFLAYAATGGSAVLAATLGQLVLRSAAARLHRPVEREADSRTFA